MKIAYSVEEVCAATGLGRTKIYEAISRGTLPAKKYGKRTLILKADLETFISDLEPYGVQREGCHG